MPHRQKQLNAFSRLLCYPDDGTAQTAEFLYVVLHGELSEAASEAAAFGAFVEQHDVAELEESFTRTFDVNPDCALEVGWHLFGEEYARGMFLVRMREEMRKYNLPESVELPDHISHVLAVVAAMPDVEAARFVTACVLPAVNTMKEALGKTDSPYRHVVSCLVSVLEQTWGAAKVESRESRDEIRSFEKTGFLDPSEVDPLHRTFPVADFTAGCGSACGGEPEVTQLQMQFPEAVARQTSPTPNEARKP